jgi:hypothetical protein
VRRLTYLLPALALALGCTEAKGPVRVHPITGKVLYDGKPAAGVQVFFMPTSAPMPPDIPMNPRGVTDDAGNFSLSTFGNGDGAADGGYQVILLWPPEEKEGVEEDGDRLMGWYDARHTKLSVHLKAEDNALPPFKLPAVNGPPPAVEGVPGRN